MYEPMQLTSSEKAKIENEKQLYVLLKMINFTEKYYSYDKIDPSTYKSEINKYIEKYNRFCHVIPGYNLENFLKKYNIPNQEVSWAKMVLEKGVHSEEQQSKETFLFMQAAVKFVQVFDTLATNQDNPVVGEIKPPLEEIHMILKRLLSKLGSQFTYKFNQYERLLKDYVQSKSITESLTQSQLQEIRLNLEGMYRMMEIIMKS